MYLDKKVTAKFLKTLNVEWRRHEEWQDNLAKLKGERLKKKRNDEKIRKKSRVSVCKDSRQHDSTTVDDTFHKQTVSFILCSCKVSSSLAF